MFDIGFQELLLVGVLALLIMGPERLPGAIRTASLWLGRLRSNFQQIKADIEREVGADEIKRQLHNEALLKSLEQAKNELNDTAQHLKPDLQQLEHDVNSMVNPTHDSHNQAVNDSPVDHHQSTEHNTKAIDDHPVTPDHNSTKQHD